LFFYGLNDHWTKPDIDNNKDIDSLSHIDNQNFHGLQVHAGEDLFCNSKPLENKIDCPDLLSENEIAKIRTNLSTIYSQAGVIIDVNYNGYDTINYDSRKEDNKLHDPIESNYAHVQLYGNDFDDLSFPYANEPYKVDVYLFNKFFKKELRGKTFGMSGRSCFINYSQQFDRTIAHEIGHASFGIFHPNDVEAIDHNNLQDSTSMDFYNLKTTHKIDEYKVRKYQWNEIQNN
jgi:hypothetical protein